MAAPAGTVLRRQTHQHRDEPLGVQARSGSLSSDRAAGPLTSRAACGCSRRTISFYQGDSTRTQDPLFVVQGHASYNVTRRAWAAVDATWYGGADVRVDGGPPSARQNNARLGATLSLPVGARQSIKLGYSTGASTRTGAISRHRSGRVAVSVVRSDLAQAALAGTSPASTQNPELGPPLEHVELSSLSVAIEDAVPVVELDPPVLFRIPGDRARQPRHDSPSTAPSVRSTYGIPSRHLPCARSRRGQSRTASAARTCRRSVRPHG